MMGLGHLERAIDRLNRRVNKHVFSYITPTVVFECAKEINFIVPAKGEVLKIFGFVRQGEVEEDDKGEWQLSYVLSNGRSSLGQHKVGSGHKQCIVAEIPADEGDVLNVKIDGPNILEASITVLYRIEITDIEMKQWLIEDLEQAHQIENN